MREIDRLLCARCGVPLEERPISLTYLGHRFPKKLPVCPLCGQPYVSEELATGPMAEIEKELEDK